MKTAMHAHRSLYAISVGLLLVCLVSPPMLVQPPHATPMR